MGMDWLCVKLGPEPQENGLKLRIWRRPQILLGPQILLRTPPVPRLASQVLEPESLTPDPRMLLLLLLLL